MPGLPSTTGLRMFVEAARHESFARAADALHVTQAAVGKQVAVLEGRLGVALFERGHRRVALTEAGRRYRPVAERVLELLESGRADATNASSRATLRVEVDPELLQFVLVPRLASLRAALPDVDCRLVPLAATPRRGGSDADWTISYGRPAGRAAASERLAGFEVFPVGAPALADGVRSPLRTLPLLYDGDAHWWAEFLDREGAVRTDPAIDLGQGTVALAAALAGAGLAIGDDLLCADALAAGALVALGECRLPGREDYWLVRGTGERGTGPADAFRRWLLDEIASMPASTNAPPSS